LRSLPFAFLLHSLKAKGTCIAVSKHSLAIDDCELPYYKSGGVCLFHSRHGDALEHAGCDMNQKSWEALREKDE